MPGEIGVSDHAALGTFLADQRYHREEGRGGFFLWCLSPSLFQRLHPQSLADSGFEMSPEPSPPNTALSAKLQEQEVEEMTAKQGETETWWLTLAQVSVSLTSSPDRARPWGEILTSQTQSMPQTG